MAVRTPVVSSTVKKRPWVRRAERTQLANHRFAVTLCVINVAVPRVVAAQLANGDSSNRACDIAIDGAKVKFNRDLHVFCQDSECAGERRGGNRENLVKHKDSEPCLVSIAGCERELAMAAKQGHTSIDLQRTRHDVWVARLLEHQGRSVREGARRTEITDAGPVVGGKATRRASLARGYRGSTEEVVAAAGRTFAAGLRVAGDVRVAPDVARLA
jgi:hypothetical protein